MRSPSLKDVVFLDSTDAHKTQTQVDLQESSFAKTVQLGKHGGEKNRR